MTHIHTEDSRCAASRSRLTFTRRELLATSAAFAAGSFVFGCGGGGGGSGADPDALVNSVFQPSTATRMDDLGDSLSARFNGVPNAIPEASALVSAGAASTPPIVAKLTGTPDFQLDNQYLAYAYVLANTGDRSAARSLADFLEANLGGSLFYAMSGLTRALRILTDQPVFPQIAFYDPIQIQSSIAAARAWIASHPEVTQRSASVSRGSALFGGASCVTSYVLTRNGAPVFWNNPEMGGQPMKITFNVQRYADLSVPPAIAQEKTSDTVAGGGTLIEQFDGSPVDPLQGRASKYSNCAGYVLFQKFGIRGLYDTLSLMRRLTAAGIVERGQFESPQKGDVVAFTTEAETPHVAVVSAVSPRVQVINKDNQGPVFLADIDAKYFTGVVHFFSRAKWTPHFYHFPTSAGNIDVMIDDDPAVTGNPHYCQDSTGNVKGVIR
jgi:hypothetical protein